MSIMLNKMKAPYPSFTKQWHNDTYAQLDPCGRAINKTIVITGASGGVGKAVAVSFAKGGAKHIALLGRRIEGLEATRSAISEVSSSTKITIHQADANDTDGLKKAAKTIGLWDVLVLNAATTPVNQMITHPDFDVDLWWSSFDVNVLGSMITFQAFKGNASDGDSSKDPPAIIQTSALLPFTPAAPIWQGGSSYTGSKIANIHIVEQLASEKPNWQVLSIHPGVLPTEMTDKVAGIENLRKYGLLDAMELPGDFFVWAATREAFFLRGKFVCANWDTDELIQRTAEFEGNEKLTLKPEGWPFS